MMSCSIKDMPNLIAPAWKPYGRSQTIVPCVFR